MTALHRRKRIIFLATVIAAGLGLSTIATPTKAFFGDDDRITFIYEMMAGVNDADREYFRQRVTQVFIEQLRDYGNYFEGRDLTPSHNTVPTQGASLLDDDQGGMDAAFGRYSYANQTGLSAGDQFSDGVKDKLSVWFNTYRNRFSNSYIASTSGGNATLFTIGADWKYSDRLLYGVSIGFNRTFMSSHTFGAQTNSEVGSIGKSVTPYISYLLGNYYGIDWGASAAFSYAHADVDLRTGGTTGETQSDYYSGSVTLNGSKWFDRWNVIGNLSYSRSNSVTDKYRTSAGVSVAQIDMPLGRISVGGRVSYYFPVWMPYVGATFNYDHLRKRAGATVAGFGRPSDDRTDVNMSGGAYFFITDDFTGNVSIHKVFGRSQSETTGVNANLRYAF